MQFPRLVYKGPATHLLVENADEHAKALKAGWFNTVPEAIGQKVEQVEPKTVVTIESLITPEEGGDPLLVVPPAINKKLTAKEKKALEKGQLAASTSQKIADAQPGAPVKQPWD